MAGRPKSFDMDVALDAFVDVFWTKGYQGTSIDDLQQVAGIKRGSFYAAFGCKDDVFATVLNKYWNEATELGLAHLKTEADPRRAVAQFIRHVGLFMSRNTPRGCLLLTSSGSPESETGQTSPLVRERMNVLEDRIFHTLHRQNGIPDEKRARELAAFALSCLLGLNALARNGQDSDKILAAADHAANAVENSGQQPAN
ncbi:MAG: TetR/AcrR family transcriptional regulator [Roseibium album]|uniref:TetR/AcrR family transcriptional regulator n=1 Tax=Roseibium album TaxID=311410 RepID=UPI0018C96CBC|nr:AcrR family transcriptional regulator [Labrenzia sp. EL_195]MBG6203091.1 AcrR family transcriptional regulator [Labrenzia sp. EL_13]